MEELKIPFELTHAGIGRVTTLLAMSMGLEQERQLKQAVKKLGYRVCITEVGGDYGEFSSKLQRAVIGASLNNGVISKSPTEVHALLHAASEAKQAFLINKSDANHMAVKVCITRGEHWIAVGMFGYSAMSTLTNHERVGLGIMHI